MARVCLCLTGKTIGEDLALIDKHRENIDIAELRVDCLLSNERLDIRRFPALAGVPVVLTIRRRQDGGLYNGTESARMVLLSRALSFAEPDLRHNFAYVDLEDDLDVPSIEEAARAFGTRIIRSYHNLQGLDQDIPAKIASLYRTGDEIAKAAFTAKSLQDVTKIFHASSIVKSQNPDKRRIIIGMGHAAKCTRILAEKLGSYLTYVSDAGDGAPGQLTPGELCGLYRFRKIKDSSAVYGVTGWPLQATASPEFFNPVFEWEGMDAVYVPFPAEDVDSLFELADEINVQGLSVTIPHKERVIPHLKEAGTEVSRIGACNTLVRIGKSGLWRGFNTDMQGFSHSLLNFTGYKTLRGKRVTIIGAGGAGRAVAEGVFQMGGKALILNRTPEKAEAIAKERHFEWGELDEAGAGLAKKRYGDVFVQTTNVGMEPDIDASPLENYRFTGREAVMDLIYKPAETRFLSRARRAGCRTLNGFDMLQRQARLQYLHFFGRECPRPPAIPNENAA